MAIKEMATMIKFRAWDNEDEIYTNNEYYFELSPDGKELELVPTNGLIIEQYTGLTDKNGKEIYEGDIVKSNYKYAQPKISQIIMEDGNSYIAGEDLATGNEMLVSDHVNEIEIIGNVHANPELLEADK